MRFSSLEYVRSKVDHACVSPSFLISKEFRLETHVGYLLDPSQACEAERVEARDEAERQTQAARAALSQAISARRSSSTTVHRALVSTATHWKVLELLSAAVDAQALETSLATLKTRETEQVQRFIACTAPSCRSAPGKRHFSGVF